MAGVKTKSARDSQFSQRTAPAWLLSDADAGGVPTPRTLVVYSGPTSMDRLRDKSGMYIDNMDYFLEHGVSCLDDAPGSGGGGGGGVEPVVVNYAFVLADEVAEHYTSPNGPITRKIRECEGVEKQAEEGGGSSPFIRVITRQDRCYDMESIRIVVTTMNVQALYDNLLFINCGLAGPKFGPGTPRLIPLTSTNEPNARLPMVPYSHWTQLYTSRLTDSVRLVGHSINTHFHTFFPHVQSFLYAIRTDTVPMLLSSGAIYDCGLTQEELGSDVNKRLELINRYEVGMSTQILKRGYKIAAVFVNRYEFGKFLVYDKDSTWGTEIDDTVSDIWYEDGIRNLAATMSEPTPQFWKLEGKGGLQTPDEDTFEHHQYDILPWDYFLFFKVSRLVPEDVQNEMKYNAKELERSNVLVIPNDPRRSPSEYWLRKTGAFVEPRNLFLDSVLIIACLVFLGVIAKNRRFLPTKGPNCHKAV